MQDQDVANQAFDKCGIEITSNAGIYNSDQLHPAGTALISDWSINSLIIFVYEKILFSLVPKTENSDWTLKKFSQSTILILFMD